MTSIDERVNSSVFQDAPDGAEAIAPADMLAFGVGAAVVGDPDLVDAEARAGDAGCDFRLEAEAILLERNLLSSDRHRLHGLDNPRQRPLLVVHGNDHGQREVFRNVIHGADSNTLGKPGQCPIVVNQWRPAP